MTRTALIAGATGLVGGQLLKQLLETPDYGQVIALVRRPLAITSPKLTQQGISFDQIEAYQPPGPITDLFCCLGTTIGQAGSKEAFRRVDLEYPLALGHLAKQQGAAYYLVSSLGADQRSAFFYNRVKGEVEDRLKALGLKSLFIFQPSLLLGKREKARFGEDVAAVVMKAVAPLILVGGMRKYRAIEAADVAAGMLAAARSGLTGAHTYESDRIVDLARGSA